ncbi:MAG TPA: hypothetical protein VFY83_13865 [Anaerolineales bacterium]|nr:hypothetical protein [Anaerolineales bacterium]
MPESQIIETGSPPGVAVAPRAMSAATFLELNYRKLRDFSLTLCRRDPDAAEDLLHHTIVKVLTLNKPAQTEAQWLGYYKSALKNNFYTRLRDVKRHGEISIDDQVINSDGEATGESKHEIERSMQEHRAKMANAKADDLRQRYWVLIWGLARPFDDVEKRILELCQQGLLIEEIAEELGVEIEYAKYRFQLLKKKIRQRVKSRAALSTIKGVVMSNIPTKMVRTILGVIDYHQSPVLPLTRPTTSMWGEYLNKQESIWARTVCTEEPIAQLIDAFGYAFLIETLELSDQMFEEIYGVMISSQERRKAIEMIRAHFARCPHCQVVDAEHNREDGIVEACIKLGKTEVSSLNQARGNETLHTQLSLRLEQ